MVISRTLVQNVIGIIGNVISFGLFISPMPTFYSIIKKKSVEEFQAYPYLCTIMNCLFWVFYGLPVVKKDNLLVLTTNVIGLTIELIYLAIYFIYTNNYKTRKRVVVILGGELMLLVVIVVIGMVVFEFSKRWIFVGIICDVFSIIMYASPLAVWKKVMKTKSVEFMPFWISLASFGNGLIWTCYAIVKVDVFILACNGIGVAFGVIQLIIYACFYSATPNRNKKEAVAHESLALEVTTKPRACSLIN